MIPQLNHESHSPSYAFFVLDVGQCLMWTNTSFTDITGHDNSQITGLGLSALANKMEFAHNYHLITDTLWDFKNYQGQGHFVNQQGETELCQLDIRPVFDHRGRLKCFIGYGVDNASVRDMAIPKLKQQVITSVQADCPKMTVEQAHVLWTKILHLICNEGIYRTANIKLKDIAYALKTNTTYVSQVINHFAQFNFHQLINEQRVLEARKQLLLPENKYLTIDAIAEQCGFKSRATFYRVFKAELNMTPKEFVGLAVENQTTANKNRVPCADL